MIRFFFLILLLLLTTSLELEAAYNPFTPEGIKVTNTALADANTSTTPIEFNNINTTPVVNTNSNVFTSVTSNGVFCIPGTYLVDIVMYQTSSVQRSNVAVEVTVNSVGTGILGANGYIRSANGHNESSSIVSDTVRLTSTSKIGFDIQRLAVAGTVAVPVGQSSMRIMRIKD
jgi:hypothetical protein